MMRRQDRADYEWLFRAAFPAGAPHGGPGGPGPGPGRGDHPGRVPAAAGELAQRVALERPEAWVRRVAIRLAVRQAGRESERGARERAGAPVPHPVEPDLDLADAVAALAPMQRATVVLHYYEDLPVLGVARLLGVSESTVKQHLYRARARLQQRLGEEAETMSIDDRIRTGLTRNADGPPPPVEQHLSAVDRRYHRRIRARWAAGLAGAAVLGSVTVPWALDRQDRPGPVARPPGVAGTYLVRVVGDAGTRSMTGTWRVQLAPDGEIVLDPPRTIPGVGTGESYTVEGDRLRTNALIAVPGCQRGGTRVATYRWAATNGAITFDPVDDGCAPRRLLFTSPWERVS